MDQEQPPLISDEASDAAERSLADDVRRLVDDGKTLLEAEIAYQKSRAVLAGAGAKGILGWGALALALVFLALMALVMGVLLALALASPLGPWGALGAVTLVVVLCAIGAGSVAARKGKRLSAMLADKDQQA